MASKKLSGMKGSDSYLATKIMRIALASVTVLVAISDIVAAETFSPYARFPRGYVNENFGDRVAPYEGFLEVPYSSYPPGYAEKSHHFTKREYTLTLTKTVGGKNFSIDIIESDHATFFEPRSAPIREFIYRGCPGRIYAYSEHLTNRPAIALYWLNAPKQRLAISVQQIPAQVLSPDGLIRFLHAMTVAKGVPALVHPREVAQPENFSDELKH
jgi:hypothetical protein